VSLYRKSSDPKDIARAENLIEFVASVNEFAERFAIDNERAALLEDFLPYVALQTDLDKVSEELDSVRLMTLHNAKGLEFVVVYLAGLEDELLPHRMSMDTIEEIEEERRLFYVGITRAKRELILSLAEAPIVSRSPACFWTIWKTFWTVPDTSLLRRKAPIVSPKIKSGRARNTSKSGNGYGTKNTSRV
jgi:DNA helicase-2/ATP-dependent DNA helicase PcrA